MRTRFTDSQKAGIFTGLVLVLAVAAALVINATGMDSNLIAWGAVWSITPTLATVIMLLLVTREGYSREGWKSLALHRFGLRVWWIAFVGTLLITLVATAAVWATPLASVTRPLGRVLNSVVNFVIQMLILATTFALAEEIGVRGYLRWSTAISSKTSASSPRSLQPLEPHWSAGLSPPGGDEVRRGKGKPALDPTAQATTTPSGAH